MSCHCVLFLVTSTCADAYSNPPQYTGLLQATTVYWDTPVHHSNLEYSSAPQYIGILQCTMVYWNTPVHHGILEYSSAPQYIGILQCTTVYWDTPVYHNILQSPSGTPESDVYTLSSNLFLSKVSVELKF